MQIVDRAEQLLLPLAEIAFGKEVAWPAPVGAQRLLGQARTAREAEQRQSDEASTGQLVGGRSGPVGQPELGLEDENRRMPPPPGRSGEIGADRPYRRRE